MKEWLLNDKILHGCFSLFFNLYYPFVVVVVSLNHVWPFSNPIDCSPADTSVHEISQARVLEWVAISFSRRSSQHRDWTHTSCIVSKFFTTEPPEKPVISLIEGLLNRFAKYLLRTYVDDRQQNIHFWKNVLFDICATWYIFVSSSHLGKAQKSVGRFHIYLNVLIWKSFYFELHRMWYHNLFSIYWA